MEHMYVDSVVVKMCWVAGCHIWKNVNCVYRIWNCPIRNRHAAEVLPLPRFYQILSWKKKEKNFYMRFKQAIQLRFIEVSSR